MKKDSQNQPDFVLILKLVLQPSYLSLLDTLWNEQFSGREVNFLITALYWTCIFLM